jgi:hypothetical protein
LKSEMLKIFHVIGRTTWKSHSITRSKDGIGLPRMQGIIIHHSHTT